MSAPAPSAHPDQSPRRTDQDRWLHGLVAELRNWYGQAGVPIPRGLHIATGTGWPGMHVEGPHVQAYMVSGGTTDDAVPQVWVSPLLHGTVTVARTVAHMLIHASLDPDTRHRAPFSHAMRAVGLEGAPLAPELGEDLARVVSEYVGEAGDYPRPPVGLIVAPVVEGRITTAPRRQESRWLAARCPVCPGHRTKNRTVQITRATADEGAPVCGRILERDAEGVVLRWCTNVMTIGEA